MLHLIWEKVYKLLIMEIDAIDNGVNQGEDLAYSINTNLSARVSTYNSPWNAPDEAGYSQHI